jgi:hypothetical protein
VIGQENHLVVDMRQEPTRGQNQGAALVTEAISSESSHLRQRRLALHFVHQQPGLMNLAWESVGFVFESHIAATVGAASSGLFRCHFNFCHSSFLIVEASSQVDAE